MRIVGGVAGAWGAAEGEKDGESGDLGVGMGAAIGVAGADDREGGSETGAETLWGSATEEGLVWGAAAGGLFDFDAERSALRAVRRSEIAASRRLDFLSVAGAAPFSGGTGIRASHLGQRIDWPARFDGAITRAPHWQVR